MSSFACPYHISHCVEKSCGLHVVLSTFGVCFMRIETWSYASSVSFFFRLATLNWGGTPFSCWLRFVYHHHGTILLFVQDYDDTAFSALVCTDYVRCFSGMLCYDDRLQTQMQESNTCPQTVIKVLASLFCVSRVCRMSCPDTIQCVSVMRHTRERQLSFAILW